MSIRDRRERERAERERLIISAARALAEAEGWEAVTTRRLAAEVEYSQPVLYSHFAGKDAIMTAVAVQGFGELAAAFRQAKKAAAGDVWRALVEIAAVYDRFASERPAVYDAMFVNIVELPFASPEAPEALHDAFAELRATVEPFAANDDPDTLAEVLWSGLHGLATLARGGRLRPYERERRLELLLDRMAANHSPGSPEQQEPAARRAR